MLGDLLGHVGLAEDLPDDAVNAGVGLGDACGQRLHGARTPLVLSLASAVWMFKRKIAQQNDAGRQSMLRVTA